MRALIRVEGLGPRRVLACTLGVFPQRCMTKLTSCPFLTLARYGKFILLQNIFSKNGSNRKARGLCRPSPERGLSPARSPLPVAAPHSGTDVTGWDDQGENRLRGPIARAMAAGPPCGESSTAGAPEQTMCVSRLIIR